MVQSISVCYVPSMETWFMFTQWSGYVYRIAVITWKTELCWKCVYSATDSERFALASQVFSTKAIDTLYLIFAFGTSDFLCYALLSSQLHLLMGFPS
ncbi:hypothetical protein GDO81_008516 [Engystomops pustulosus]|uniref:Uncharacterized protein n=1 Tax=Engystomops pustulosus TaxID=76066 RepID=A0AAV7CHB0_ENGPU|nr:hypothetical protein GDO81_008516 [Engystomops pustulosus]